jgi:hypothetical protein
MQNYIIYEPKYFSILIKRSLSMKLPANNLLVLLILCFVFIIPAVVSAIPQTVLLISGSDTQSAGYTSLQPSNPLGTSSFSNGGWSSASATSMSGWYSASQSPFGSGATWVSSATTTEGGIEDQWRLFKIDFDIPEGSTINSAQLWYTADNAVSVYLNDAEISSNGVVYGDAPSPQPYLFQNSYSVNFNPIVGSNTLKFVVRNWNGDVTYNPTGLLYKGIIEYESQENQPPQVFFSPISPNDNEKITFDASLSQDPDGKIISYQWDFGNGEIITKKSSTISKKYKDPGQYLVRLTVTDNKGASSSITKPIIIECPKCKIEVRAHPIPEFPLAYHLFIIYTDPQGKENFFRGDHSKKLPWVIVTDSGKYKPNAPDWYPGAPTVTALSGWEAFNKDQCFVGELNRIKSLKIPYEILGPNSNTVVSTLLDNCDVKRVKPNVDAPGWDSGNLDNL